MKICSKCSRELPLDKFYKDVTRNKYRADCIECYNLRQAERRVEWQNKPKGIVFKTCSFCRESKLVDKCFHKDCRQQDGYGSRCTECKKLSHKAYMKEYRKGHAKARRVYDISWKLKCAPEEVQKYIEVSENGICQICGKTAIENGKSLSIDHCHATNKIRGVLCQHCNKGLGHFFDNPDILLKAISYLNK